MTNHWSSTRTTTGTDGKTGAHSAPRRQNRPPTAHGQHPSRLAAQPGPGDRWSVSAYPHPAARAKTGARAARHAQRTAIPPIPAVSLTNRCHTNRSITAPTTAPRPTATQRRDPQPTALAHPTPPFPSPDRLSFTDGHYLVFKRQQQ